MPVATLAMSIHALRVVARDDASVRPADDVQLVRAAREGDEAAFEELVRRHAPRLHAVVLRLARNPAEASDITQEAFLRAWRGLPRFQGTAAFSTWLHRIGVNEAHRRAGRGAAARQETSLEEAVAEPREPGPGPAARAEHRELRVALERAIADLRFDLRAPLVLRDVEGLSTREAAEVLGLGEAAFKSRLHRARAAVRAAVASYLPAEDQD